MLKNGLIF